MISIDLMHCMVQRISNVSSTSSIIETGRNSSSSSSSKTKNQESGYTPLHVAIYNRDITTMLLLLGHGSAASADYNNNNNDIVHDTTSFGSIHTVIR